MYHNKTCGYVYGQLLGKGRDGSIYMATHKKTGKSYAIKKYELHDNFYIPVTALREVCSLVNLSHPNICKLHEVYIDQLHINIVLDLLDNTLIKHLDDLYNEKERHKLVLQLIDSLSYLHSMNYIHGDLSLTNIMLQDTNIKLIDFSLSTRTHRPYNIMKPTIYVCPPEIFDSAKKKTESIDTWMLACVIYFIFANVPLFACLTDETHLDNIFETLSGNKNLLSNKDKININQIKYENENENNICTIQKPSLELIKGHSEFRLIKKMLQLNPTKRIKIYKLKNDIITKQLAIDNNYYFTSPTDPLEKYKLYNTALLKFKYKSLIVNVLTAINLDYHELIVHTILNCAAFLSRVSLSEKNIQLLIVSVIGICVKIITEFEIGIDVLIDIANSFFGIHTLKNNIVTMMTHVLVVLKWDLDIYTAYDYIENVRDEYKSRFTIINLLLLLMPLSLSEQEKILILHKVLTLDNPHAININETYNNIQRKYSNKTFVDMFYAFARINDILSDPDNSINKLIVQTYQTKKNDLIWLFNINFKKLINKL